MAGWWSGTLRTVGYDGATEEEALTLLVVREVERRALAVDVVIENKPLQLLVDAGLSVSILPNYVYQAKFANWFPLTAATAMLGFFREENSSLGTFHSQSCTRERFCLPPLFPNAWH
ncbi:hypothetical protein MRX96_049601 [Rhipicephalus microplus]